MTVFGHSHACRTVGVHISVRIASVPCNPTRLAQLLACAFAASCFTGHALADETRRATEHTLPAIDVNAPQENGRLNLDTPSSTGSRLGLTPRETPATVTIVDRATIDARGADDTQEILKAIPGVTAHNAPGSIGVSYRGFNSGSLSQLYNGIDVKYTIANRAVDSWIVDRVEAIGGASSFLNGAGAIGGSINYITKLAQRQDISEGRIRLGTDNLKEASIGLNRRVAGGEDGSPAHYARIDLNHRGAGNWIDGTRTDSTQLATSLLSDLGRGLTHTLAYEYQNEQVDRPYWGTPLLKPTVGALRIDEATRFKNYNSADGEYAQRVQWLRSITDLQVNDALHVTNTFYVYDAQRDYKNVENYAFNASNTLIQRSGGLLQRHDQRLVGNRLDGTYKGELGGKRSDWSFGLDLSLNTQTRFPTSTPNSFVVNVNPYDFTTGNFFGETGLTPGYNPDRTNKITTVAAYVENRTALIPTLNLVTALRIERIDLDLINRRAISASAPASYQRSYTPVTGRIGLVWDITPNAMAYIQYATAADPPAGSLSTASFANAITNTELTTGKQVEIGSKLDFWQGRGNAAIAAYSITRENFGITDPTNSNNTLLVGKQTSNGIDLSLGLQLTKAWSMQGSFTYVDAYYNAFFDTASRAGNTPTNTPATVANLWTTYAFTPALKASAGIRRVGKVYGNAANTTVWPHYTLLDLGLSYQISPKMSLIGRIKNVTDEIYAASVSANSVYLGAPRTADVTLRIAF